MLVEQELLFISILVQRGVHKIVFVSCQFFFHSSLSQPVNNRIVVASGANKEVHN